MASSSSSSLKGTRKTYSFEEREILITLINKYEDVEDKKSDPTSMCKRKSAWAQLAEEYNSMVGPQGTRSAVQLRRCWENMKACKKNREEKRYISKNSSHLTNDTTRMNIHNWENGNSGHNSSETPLSTGNVGLPPNVVFEPKASEPFTLQSVSASKVPKLNLKRELEHGDSGGGSCAQITVISDLSKNKLDIPPSMGPMGDCLDKSMTDRESSIDDNQSEREEISEKKVLNCKSNGTQTLVSHLVLQGRIRKTNKVSQREEELHVLALSEAQMKVDIAMMQKEEARVKLEEAHYRKEEARLRMLFFTYKLDRIKED